jgi:hypothetical protein
MRKLKLFLISVLILLVFLSLITVFLPSKITISKSTLIDATENKVAGQIRNFNNWKNWYPAFQNGNRIIRIQDSSLVAITDEKQHTLSMKIVEIETESITIVLKGGDQNNTTYQFILSPNGNGKTLIVWNVNTKLSWYPWKRLTGVVLDKIAGPQYEAALENLKTAVEKMHQVKPSE